MRNRPEPRVVVVRPSRLAFAIRMALRMYTAAIVRTPDGEIHHI